MSNVLKWPKNKNYILELKAELFALQTVILSLHVHINRKFYRNTANNSATHKSGTHMHTHSSQKANKSVFFGHTAT